MNDENFLKHPNLKNLDPRKKGILSNLLKESKGKPMNQCFPAIMKANQTLQAQGLSFSPKESSAIMDLLSADMNPADRARFEMMKNMMNNMKH
ncbi:hypothetical protein lbkm_2590 [Lachnospiraceae bacterium KM106-2]|nr:hypothetical protein lbkm_2590 [Lachnospiraceae bacterium KM106-2]